MLCRVNLITVNNVKSVFKYINIYQTLGLGPVKTSFGSKCNFPTFGDEASNNKAVLSNTIFSSGLVAPEYKSQ